MQNGVRSCNPTWALLQDLTPRCCGRSEFMPVAGSVVPDTLVPVSRSASALNNPYGLTAPRTPEEAAALIRNQLFNGELGSYSPKAQLTAADLRAIAKYEGPSFRAWDGKLGISPQEKFERDIGMALAGPPSAALLGVAGLGSASAVTVGGAVLGGGMDAAGQYAQTGTVEKTGSGLAVEKTGSGLAIPHGRCCET